MASRATPSKTKIPLITLAPTSAAPADRLGGKTHGLVDRLANTVEVDAEKLRKNLEEAITKLDGALAKLPQAVSKNWKIENISVGLSVSAEGSVGIATAGVEASIEVTFSPKTP
ncbi:Pepco domain-containing protein [Hydrogenophaga sp. BPS33]|uniref:Pepco domain-containing protein n=1 Tax=Hydrogenophaga sp. BPS33 TaxID=2651974 RepID=UPI00131F807D|nr:hypothetical protein [Hydrogenophaga sp. BPS33]QHE87604.1 hypothetical protein F9K07_23250 [Hydrogenophaga sp. BPS33]